MVGVVEDGKYRTLTEDQQPAMFFSFQQQQSSGTWLLVRSSRDPAEISTALERTMHGLDARLPFMVRTWNHEMGWALFAARVATVALGVLGLLGAMLAVTGIFGMASYTVSKRLRELGIRVALGARRQAGAASRARSRIRGCCRWARSRDWCSAFWPPRCCRTSSTRPRLRIRWCLVGVVLTMLLLGLTAAWIPAQRALAVDPIILLREE